MTSSLKVATGCAICITVAIASGAFLLSFAALSDLAVKAGQPKTLAWIWPVIVDGAILQATISVVALAPSAETRSARGFFWTVLAVAASVSIAGNALHAAVSTTRTLAPLVGAGVATVAPVSLLAATHGLTLLLRSARRGEDSTASATDAATETAPRGEKPSIDLDDPERTAKDAPAREATAEADRGDIAVNLKDSGWSNRRIAVELGVHHKTVGRLLAKAAEPTQLDAAPCPPPTPTSVESSADDSQQESRKCHA
ncbi:MAG: DUF2637 domain-containing protein [Williamsia sp.]|nr:DUF2637 domain-containing protein [Williamsia sp.]